MTDFLFLDKYFKMKKQMPRPRLISRKGISVRGFFRPYMSLSDYTASCIFKSNEVITPIIIRFSSVLGDRGTADTVRNFKSMGIKFITDDGSHDVVFSSIPVQLTNNREHLSKLCDAFSCKMPFDGIDKNALWKYVTENHEALNCVMHLYSYEGILDSFIDINWYSVNKYTWNNKNNDKWYVRYKVIPLSEKEDKSRQRSEVKDRIYAEFAAGIDPDIAFNELENRISNKKYPVFQVLVQMIDVNDPVDEYISDRTVMWEEAKYPYLPIGTLLADRVDSEADDLITFVPGRQVDGISMLRTEIDDLADLICRIDEVERGTDNGS